MFQSIADWEAIKKIAKELEVNLTLNLKEGSLISVNIEKGDHILRTEDLDQLKTAMTTLKWVYTAQRKDE